MYLKTKRCLDVVAGILGMFAFGSVFWLVVLALKLEGHEEFWEHRLVIGPNRRRIQRGIGVYERRRVWHPGRPLILRFFATTMDTAYGPQLTPVGKVLVATGISALPLSWYLLTGKISLVGPHFLELGEYLRCRDRMSDESPTPFHLPPGMTGLAQLADDLGEESGLALRRLSLDRQYIQRCGLRLDLTILLFAVLERAVGRRPVL